MIIHFELFTKQKGSRSSIVKAIIDSFVQSYQPTIEYTPIKATMICLLYASLFIIAIFAQLYE